MNQIYLVCTRSAISASALTYIINQSPQFYNVVHNNLWLDEAGSKFKDATVINDWWNVDGWLVLAIGSLCLMGLLYIGSATSDDALFAAQFSNCSRVMFKGGAVEATPDRADDGADDGATEATSSTSPAALAAA